MKREKNREEEKDKNEFEGFLLEELLNPITCDCTVCPDFPKCFPKSFERIQREQGLTLDGAIYIPKAWFVKKENNLTKRLVKKLGLHAKPY